MGGIAVVIDWERSTVFQDLSPMLALIPHRSAGGATTAAAAASTTGTFADQGRFAVSNRERDRVFCPKASPRAGRSHTP